MASMATWREDALHLEGQGVLEKYGAGHLVGSKWQKRYVKCQRDILEIHHYKGAPPARGAVPSRIVDLQETDRLLAKPDTLTLELFQRRDGARSVLLRASTVGELEFWAGIIRAKIAYCQARAAAGEEGAEAALKLRFATNSFTMLSLMEREEEVAELAEATVEEAFQQQQGGDADAGASLPDLSELGDEDVGGGGGGSGEEEGEAAPSWAAGGGGDSPVRRSGGDWGGDTGGGGGGMMTMELAVAGIGRVLATLEDLVGDLEAELCAAAEEDGEGGVASKKVALVDRLFEQYYGQIEDRLVLEAATATPVGQRAEGGGALPLAEQPVGALMAGLAGWRRLRRFERRLEAAVAALPGDLGSARRLGEGSALAAVLVPEAALVGCVVALALREAEGAWGAEVAAVERFYMRSSSTREVAYEEEPSPRRFTVLSVGCRPLSGAGAGAAAAAADGDRRPSSLSAAPPTPRLSSAVDALERLLEGIEPAGGEEGDGDGDGEEARAQAAFLRGKAFTSAVLFLSGQVPALPLQPVRGESDEALVLAVIEELRRCQERVAAVQRRFFAVESGGEEGEAASGSGGGAGGDMAEVAGVFAQAAERFAADRAGSLLLDHALRGDAQLQRLLGMLFVHRSWRQGEVTPLLIGRFRQVLEGAVQGKKQLAGPLLERMEARLLRAFLVLYLRQLLQMPANSRALEAEDAMAFLVDETAVQEWVEFRGRWFSRARRLEDLWVLKRIRIWLLMPPDDALEQFAEAWLQAHPTLGPHLYDLLRFLLLLRRDVDAAATRAALEAVREFLVQVTAAAGRMAVSPAPVPSPVKILAELFPRAGTQHVTGEAWRWEAPAAGSREEQEALALAVEPLVLKTCEKLRLPKPAPSRSQDASPERILPVLQLLPAADTGPGTAAVEAPAPAPAPAPVVHEVAPAETAKPPPPPQSLPEPIIPVVTISPRAQAAAVAAVPPMSPGTASSAGSSASANPFEEEDDEPEQEEAQPPRRVFGGGMLVDDEGPAEPPPSSPPPPPQRPSPTGAKRVFGGDMLVDDEQAPPPPQPKQEAAPPSPPSSTGGRRLFGGGAFFRSGTTSPRATFPRGQTPPPPPQQQQQQAVPVSPSSSGQQPSRRVFGGEIPVVAAAPPAVAVANPFADDEEEEEAAAVPAAAVAPASSAPPPPRRVFGGAIPVVQAGGAVATATAPASAPQQPAPPQRRVFGGEIPVAASTAAAAAVAPSSPPPPPQRRHEATAAAAAAPAPRRFGGAAWDGEDGVERPVPPPVAKPPQAQPGCRSPLLDDEQQQQMAGRRNNQQQQQQQQQQPPPQSPPQQQRGGGRRSFGGQGGGDWW